jgi:hypothetical protein
MRSLKFRERAAFLAAGVFMLLAIVCPEVQAQAPARPE